VIFAASTTSDYEAFARVVRDYVDWCRWRYRTDAWFVDQVLSHQSLDRELQDLSSSYGPPNGKTFLARDGDEVCGGVAYRRLSNDICEMKRLFVFDRFQGKGYGRRLCQALIAAAKDEGYKLMRLDTANLLSEAIALYESLGFRRCAPYIDYPDRLMPYLMFMEMPLAGAA